MGGKVRTRTAWPLLALALVIIAVGCGGRRAEQAREQGDTYLRLGRYDEAEAQYRAALRHDVEDPGALLGLARVLRTQDHDDEALRLYAECVEALTPLDSDEEGEGPKLLEDAYRESVGLLLEQGNADESEALAQAYRQYSPEPGGVLLAHLYRDTDRGDEAVSVLRSLLEAPDHSEEVRIHLANYYLAEKLPEKAEVELQTVLTKRNPDSVAARMLLIDAYQMQGKLPEIIAECEALAAAHPDDMGLQLALASSLLNGGEVEKAEAIARPVLAEWPDSGWANYLVGSCLLAQNKFSDAVAYLETAAQQEPHQSAISEKLAYAKSGGTALPATTPTASTPVPAIDQAQEPAPRRDWPFLWQSAQLRALLAAHAAHASKTDTKLARTLVLAALFERDSEALTELMPTVAANSPVGRLAAAYQAGDVRAMIAAVDAWTPQGPLEQEQQTNARGFAYAQGRARSHAVKAYQEALTKWPDQVVAYRNLASIYQDAGMAEFASRCMQQIVQRYPNSVEAREVRFEMLYAANQLNAARLLAESTRSLFPDRPEAVRNLARVYVRTGDSKLAIDVLKRGLESQVDHPVLQRALAEAYLHAGDAAASAALLDALPDAGALRVATAAALGENDQVLSTYATIPPEDRTLPVRLYAISVQPDRDTALGYLDATVELAPNRGGIVTAALGAVVPGLTAAQFETANALAATPEARSRFAQGLACREDGLYQRAFALLSEVNVAIPGHAAVVSVLFDCLARAQEMDERQAVAVSLADQLSDQAAAWMGLAAVHASVGDTAQQRAALDKALEQDPNDPGVWEERAVFLYTAGEIEAACEAFAKLAEYYPDNPAVQNNLAYCLLQSGGDANEALALSQKALVQTGNEPNTLHTLGMAYLKAGQPEQAKETLAIALDLRPSDPTILLDYGHTLIALQDEDAGKDHIGLALDYAERLGVEFPRKAEAESVLGAL